MKIQCDVCERAAATVVCCADEAALCSDCDVQIHAANKLASKHPRILLSHNTSVPSKLPRCDICQERPAFIFCVEDRALFCRDCDEPIHVAGSLSGNHQRLLATGIGVALSSSCKKSEPTKSKKLSESPKSKPLAASRKSSGFSKSPLVQEVPSAFSPPSAWSVEELFRISDYESTDKKGPPLGFGELDWFSDMGIFHNDYMPSIDSPPAAMVPEMPKQTQLNNTAYYRHPKSGMVSKRPRIEDLDDFFTVPDLG